jgi:hypothetical protein
MACAALASSVSSVAADPLLQWAYPVNPPGLQPPPDDGIPRRVPGSAAAFTFTQSRDLFEAPDWHCERLRPGDLGDIAACTASRAP